MSDVVPRLRARLLGPVAIGQANRRRVLELLHQNGPSSRADLARQLEVNRATIASILQPLIDDRTLVEGDSVASSPLGGKPARPLWFNHDGPQLGAMRIAPGLVTAARMRVDGTVVARAQGRFRADAPLASVERQVVRIATRCFGTRPLLGIGVAGSGMVDTTTGRIISLHLAPNLNGFEVGPLLHQRFAVPVAVDHHPRVQALGDKWFGAGRGLSSFASVYTGEALGFGIVHDGEIIRGEGGAGGEYGHTVVDMHGRLCVCGRRGCWETVATLGWLREEAARRGLADADGIDCGSLVRLVEGGEATAGDLLIDYAENLAIGMANNEHMLGSGTYIMHGDVCAGGERMRALLEDRLQTASPRRGAPLQVIMASTKDEMTLLGGGGLVLSAVLDDGL